MGQKVHPGRLARRAYINDWRSRLVHPSKRLRQYLEDDLKVRELSSRRRVAHAALSVDHRAQGRQELTVDICTARPGIVIGKTGPRSRRCARSSTGSPARQIQVNIIEIKRPELDAELIAQSIAEQLEAASPSGAP